MDIYPAGLVIKLYGCSAGNIARDSMTPGESFLFGRAITQTVITHTKPQGGAFKSIPQYMFEDLFLICPNMGTAYQFMYDFRGSYAYSLILLGNPFVKIQKELAAPHGSVSGTVKLLPPSAKLRFYVSICQNGKSFGRVKTLPNSDYELQCLPPGDYEVSLHINALESIKKKVRVYADRTTRIDWDVPPLWQVEGYLLAMENDKPIEDSWIEIAETRKKDNFKAHDLFPIAVDTEGRFSIVGAGRQRLWVRGRVGKKNGSKSIRVDVRQGEQVDGIILKINTEKRKN